MVSFYLPLHKKENCMRGMKLVMGEGREVPKPFPHHFTCSRVRDGRGPRTYVVLWYTLPTGVAKMGELVIGSVNRLLATSSGRWKLQVIHTSRNMLLVCLKAFGTDCFTLWNLGKIQPALLREALAVLLPSWGSPLLQFLLRQEEKWSLKLQHSWVLWE